MFTPKTEKIKQILDYDPRNAVVVKSLEQLFSHTVHMYIDYANVNNIVPAQTQYLLIPKFLNCC